MAKRYYDFDGTPVTWDEGSVKLPKKMVNGKEETLYNFVKFFREATPISKSAYDKLVKESKDSK